MIFEATERGKSCSDLGKTSIQEQEICENAGKQMGMTWNGVHDETFCPKGCCYMTLLGVDLVWWSLSESENIAPWAGQLCSDGGKFFLHVSFLYQNCVYKQLLIFIVNYKNLSIWCSVFRRKTRSLSKLLPRLQTKRMYRSKYLSTTRKKEYLKKHRSFR